jgi:hypothetical protein
VFTGDELLTTAIVDRLLHKRHVLNIKARTHSHRDLDQAVETRTRCEKTEPIDGETFVEVGVAST